MTYELVVPDDQVLTDVVELGALGRVDAADRLRW